MQLPFHSIADDHHQRLIVHRAVTQAREQARSAFLFGLSDEMMGSEWLDALANEAWAHYHARVRFDYPAYARDLFFNAYHAAYRTYLRNLADAVQTDVEALTTEILAANVRRNAHRL